MFPILLQLGPLQLSTNTVLLVIGALVGLFLIWKKTRQEHYEVDAVFDALILSAIVGVIGAKVGHIISITPWLSLTGIETITDAFLKNGYLEQVGLLTGLGFLYWYLHREKWDAFEFLDFLSPSLALILIFNWVGRFFAGAYLGTVTALPIGLTFPSVFDRRHPLQLYFAVAYLLLFGLLYFFESRYRFFEWYRAKRQTVQSGFLFGFFILYYGLTNAVLSYFSASPLIIISWQMSTILSAVIVGMGIWIIFYRSGHWQRKKNKSQRVRYGSTPRALLWFARLRRSFKK